MQSIAFTCILCGSVLALFEKNTSCWAGTHSVHMWLMLLYFAYRSQQNWFLVFMCSHMHCHYRHNHTPKKNTLPHQHLHTATYTFTLSMQRLGKQQQRDTHTHTKKLHKRTYTQKKETKPVRCHGKARAGRSQENEGREERREERREEESEKGKKEREGRES